MPLKVYEQFFGFWGKDLRAPSNTPAMGPSRLYGFEFSHRGFMTRCAAGLFSGACDSPCRIYAGTQCFPTPEALLVNANKGSVGNCVLTVGRCNRRR